MAIGLTLTMECKGTMGGPPGSFRATFEDKVLRSDIVFLRSWVSVEIPKFCNMVTNMLFRTLNDTRKFKRSDSKDTEAIMEESKPRLHIIIYWTRGLQANSLHFLLLCRTLIVYIVSNPVALLLVFLDVDQLEAAALQNIEEFEASNCFNGPRPGCVFKTGDSGLGYYRYGQVNLPLFLGNIMESCLVLTQKLIIASRDMLVPVSVETRMEIGKQESEWRRMRTVAELRRERGIGAPKIGDSEYRPVERTVRKWLPMQIPKSLIAELPMKTKPTVKSKSKDAVKAERSVIVREPHEKKVSSASK